MKEIEMLEMELILIQDNIKRMKEFKSEFKKGDWKPCNSSVVGEFKHRIIALKQRLTLASKINTNDYLN